MSTSSRGDALLGPTVTRRLLEKLVSRPPQAPRDDFAGCELEVLKLVARRVSNAESANELVLGEATVKTYVTRLLATLGLRDRVQIVVYAYETGIVRPGVDG